MHIDFFGQKLSIGDRILVARNSTYSSAFQLKFIVGLTDKHVVILKSNGKRQYIKPTEVIKMTDEMEKLYTIRVLKSDE